MWVLLTHMCEYMYACVHVDVCVYIDIYVQGCEDETFTRKNKIYWCVWLWMNGAYVKEYIDIYVQGCEDESSTRTHVGVNQWVYKWERWEYIHECTSGTYSHTCGSIYMSVQVWVYPREYYTYVYMYVYTYMNIYIFKNTADPTWGDILESSKLKNLECLFCPVSVKRDVRALSFELWNNIRKCHWKWDWLYI